MRLTIIVPTLGLCVALTAAAISGDPSGPSRESAGCDQALISACAGAERPDARPAPYRLGSAIGRDAPVLAKGRHATSG